MRMPRVVPDQREKFENDELFLRLSRETEIRYTGHRELSHQERMNRLQSDCREGHADIVFLNLGINLQLVFESNSWSEQPDDRVVSSEFVDFDREPGKVHLKSQFIMNGVCVIWRGWLDLTRLDGTAHLEYDEDRARVEDGLLRAQIEQYNQQVRSIQRRHQYEQQQQQQQLYHQPQHHHHLQHQQQQQQQQLQQQQQQGRQPESVVEAEVVQALLDFAAPTTQT